MAREFIVLAIAVAFAAAMAAVGYQGGYGDGRNDRTADLAHDATKISGMIVMPDACVKICGVPRVAGDASVTIYDSAITAPGDGGAALSLQGDNVVGGAAP